MVRKARLEEGAKVEGNYRGSGKWYRGRISLFLFLVFLSKVPARRVYNNGESVTVGLLADQQRNLSDEYVSSAAESHNKDKRRRRLLSQNDHKVTNLPGLSSNSGLVHYAGHLLADPSKGGNLFCWLFETPNDPLNGSSRPTIVATNSLDSPVVMLLNEFI